MSADKPRSVLMATIVSMLIAGLVLVTVVLPAEFGIDPLRTGEMLGLLGLARHRSSSRSTNARAAIWPSSTPTLKLTMLVTRPSSVRDRSCSLVASPSP